MARPSKHPHAAQKDPAYTAYEDLPPPSPEEGQEIIARLLANYDQLNQSFTERRRAKLLSWIEWAP